MNLAGVFPPIPTPFNSDESLALDKLTDNFNRWNKIPFRGYVVLGSNGEAPLLSFDEKCELMKCARGLIDKDRLLLAGSGCESTRETIKLSAEFANIGADAVLVATPWFFKGRMTTSALEAHFTNVADTCTVPVILYNVPANTGVELEASSIIKLASHPNIIGVKDSGGNITKLARLVYETKDLDFQVIAGSAGFLLASLNAGAVGGVCASANVLGNETCQLQQLFAANKLDEARELQGRLIVPNDIITRGLGVPALKHMLDLFGFYGGPARSPLPPTLTKSEAETTENAFKKYGFKW